MKTLIFCLLGIFLFGCMGCATPPPKPYTYNGALSELYRNGVPDTRTNKGMAPQQLTGQTCTSAPIFSYYGEFIRYDVRCR